MIDCDSLIYKHYYVLKRFSSDELHIGAYDIMQAVNAYLGRNGDPITLEQLDAIKAFYNCDKVLPPVAPIGPPVAEAGMGGILMLGLCIGILYFMMKSKR